MKTTAMEPATTEPATAVEPATPMESTTAVDSTTATAVEPATTATVHLRVSSSDTTKNRECRDTCDGEFLQRRLSHRNLLRPF